MIRKVTFLIKKNLFPILLLKGFIMMGEKADMKESEMKKF
ncbi:hypothetical protein B4072_2946 [Bacillus subtilis]|nr:hypothetical protein B4069_2955 [Bacillus subtilis]KIN46717.1 hypothetical protein B4072_2946 [Bacillus subtilis]